MSAMKSHVMFKVAGCVIGAALVFGHAAAPQGQAPAAPAQGGRGGAPAGPPVCQGTPAFAAQQAAANANTARAGMVGAIAAIEQRATVLCRLDPLTVAVEQTHAEGVLQIRNRLGNVGLRGVEASRSLPHAAVLHDGHEDVQVLQLDPAADTIA